MSFSHLILNASTLVQLVMLALLLASVVSWFLIVRKSSLIGSMRKSTDRFENNFWSGGRLHDIYEAVRRHRNESALEALFRAGYEEFERSRQSGTEGRAEIIAAVQRSLRVAHMREVDRLEGGLAVLATIGSTSPYVGLFGWNPAFRPSPRSSSALLSVAWAAARSLTHEPGQEASSGA